MPTPLTQAQKSDETIKAVPPLRQRQAISICDECAASRQQARPLALRTEHKATERIRAANRGVREGQNSPRKNNQISKVWRLCHSRYGVHP